MTYLLDTNAISGLMRAAPRIENWMAGLDEDDRVVTCTIVRGEVLFGWQVAGGQTAYRVRTDGTPVSGVLALRASA